MNINSFPSVPRIESLQHRLKTAKGPDGEPLTLIDDLMFFLEDPPQGVGDRWQAGAELCAAQGITASRIAVWRWYRAHVLQWRCENAPLLEDGGLEKSTAQLLEKARHLVALRAVESLNDPRLSPHVLVGLVQNENRRQALQLAREKFNHDVDAKLRPTNRA